MQLVLIRHGESVWNKENLFTGWTDVDLSETGVEEAKTAGKLLMDADFDFDICYTSYLKRATSTLNNVLKVMDREWLPVYKSWKLNEKSYGALQGLNKAETAAKYGDDQVLMWRRSYTVQPPAIELDDPRNPRTQEQYRAVKDKEQLPLTEALCDTVARVIPYFEEEIKPQMKAGKRVIIAAHGNSLRALVKYLDNMTDEEIISLNIPTGVPLVYDLTDDFKVQDKYYLGDQDAIAAKMNAVANQGKAK